MIIKVQTWIYLDVKDEQQGEDACHTLRRLDGVIAPGFPNGEVLDADVDHFEEVSEAEIEERGLQEA